MSKETAHRRWSNYGRLQCRASGNADLVEWKCRFGGVGCVSLLGERVSICCRFGGSLFRHESKQEAYSGCAAREVALEFSQYCCLEA
jgi:hypothetical protein